MIIFDKCAKGIDMKSDAIRPAGISLRADQLKRISEESVAKYKSSQKKSLHVQMILDEYWAWKDAQEAAHVVKESPPNPARLPQEKKHRVG